MAKTLEELKELQGERATKFGILVKENYGSIEKPEVHSEVADDDFADPVHYLYPVNDKANTLASMRTYDSWDNVYSKSEKQIILARLYTAIDKFKVDMRGMYFAEAENKNVSDSDEWIDLFKIGKQTDSSGNTKEWTDEELQTIVDKYNEQEEENKHRAPAIAGEHLDDKKLIAYGWVKELKVEKGHLYGKFEKIDNDFKAMVNDGKFNTVSIALYPDLLLQHVAFLGAIPPAVKGLKAPQFSRENEQPILLTYSSKTKKDKPIIKNYAKAGTMTLDEFIKAVVDAVKASDGDEVASNVRATMEKLKDSVVLTAPTPETKADEPKAKFSESAEFIALKQEMEIEKNKRAKIELDLQKERDSKFFSEVIRTGVMLPAQLQPAENVLEAIRNPQPKYQFSEGAPEVTGEEAFKEFVKSYPQIVQFSEVATQDKAAEEAKKNKYAQIQEQLKNGK